MSDPSGALLQSGVFAVPQFEQSCPCVGGGEAVSEAAGEAVGVGIMARMC